MNFLKKISLTNADVVICEPFPIFEFHNLFDVSIFRKLQAEFPDKTLFPGRYLENGGKFHWNSTTREFNDFLEKSPIWKDLFQLFSKPEIVAEFYALTQQVPSERTPAARKPWQLCFGEKDGFLQGVRNTMDGLKARLLDRIQVRLLFEFSCMEQGCYIPPHTDLPEKLLSLMIYFPEEDITYPHGTGTEFYRKKPDNHEMRSWKSTWIKGDGVHNFFESNDTFYTSQFTANKMVGFVKTSNSWHGVRQLNLPMHVLRRSLNVNYLLIR